MPTNPLAELVSISDADFAQTSAEAKANHARLNACPRHSFFCVNDNVLNRRYKCEVCNGEIDGIAYKWYERGKRDGQTL